MTDVAGGVMQLYKMAQVRKRKSAPRYGKDRQDGCKCETARICYIESSSITAHIPPASYDRHYSQVATNLAATKEKLSGSARISAPLSLDVLVSVPCTPEVQPRQSISPTDRA
ncbi:unnamed protein product [Calypogeia fissa]